MKNFDIMGFTKKFNFYGGGVAKNQYTGGNCLKRRAWTIYRFTGERGEAW